MSAAAIPVPTINQRSELIFPLAVMAMILVLIVPLPTALLDVLLTCNLSVTVLLLLVTLGVGQPLELPVFPSTLLVLTLARLSLNVATTRLILLQADAGRIVETFGNFVIGGQEVARGTLQPDRVLAISPDGSLLPLPGLDTKDPAFGLPAKWISENERSQAELLGTTVVDAPSVLITHLREVLKRFAGELLGREDLTKLVDQVKATSAAVVDELIPNLLSMGTIHRVLTALLEERVPITNMTRIFEALAHHAPTIKEPLELAERVRGYLPRAICEPLLDAESRIHAIVFEPHLELELRRSLQEKDKRLSIPPDALEALIVRLATALRDTSQRQLDVALLVDSQLRRPIRQLLSRGLPDLAVIAYTEVPNDVQLEAAAIVKRDEIYGRKPEAAAFTGE